MSRKFQRPTDAEPATFEERCVFSIMTGTGPPTIVIGIPRPAYERMKDGKTLHFENSELGLRIVMFGAADHAAAVKVLQDSAARIGVTIDDQRRKDSGIKL